MINNNQLISYLRDMNNKWLQIIPKRLIKLINKFLKMKILLPENLFKLVKIFYYKIEIIVKSTTLKNNIFLLHMKEINHVIYMIYYGLMKNIVEMMEMTMKVMKKMLINLKGKNFLGIKSIKLKSNLRNINSKMNLITFLSDLLYILLISFIIYSILFFFKL